MTASSTQIANASVAASVGASSVRERSGFGFRDILAALNPLQYLPVVGTIYRAVTGDVIAEPLRLVGSLLVSGLLGGPVAVAISLATTAAAKITGLDPEKIVAAQFHTAASPVFAVGHEAPTTIRPALSIPPTPSASAGLAMTPRQLAAYGVHMDASGTLKLGEVSGADVLNIIELGRHARAAAAYAAKA